MQGHVRRGRIAWLGLLALALAGCAGAGGEGAAGVGAAEAGGNRGAPGLSVVGAAGAPPAAGASAVAAAPLAAGACGMAEGFRQPDRDTPGRPPRMIPVWTEGEAARPRALFFGHRLQINTDGTPRSYSVDDPRGERFALNAICNAMSGYCTELDAAGRAARFADLRRARDGGWQDAALAASTRLSANVIPRRGPRDPRVCEESVIDGNRYLVSSTALQDQRRGGACGLASYVDSSTVNALVMPGLGSPFAATGARRGDLVVAWRSGMEAPVYGVIGDLGEAEKFGEGSIALNGALLRRTESPPHYQALRRAWVVDRAHVLVFPRSRANPALLTQPEIAPLARQAFLGWGGGSEEAAFARLRGCARDYDRAAPSR